MTGISKSQVSRLCGEIDDKVQTFLTRPLEGDWPYVWLDATYVTVRHAGRIVSVARWADPGCPARGDVASRPRRRAKSRRTATLPSGDATPLTELLDRVPGRDRGWT